MKDHDVYLALLLLCLVHRMQRGEHLQEGGQALVREYRKVKAAMGKGVRKAKPDHSAVDAAMAEQVASCDCGACGGVLKQARSGSLRAICQACAARWDFEAAASAAPEVQTDPVQAGTNECRECFAFFAANNPDSGCGICVGCMADLQSELLPPEEPTPIK